MLSLSEKEVKTVTNSETNNRGKHLAHGIAGFLLSKVNRGSEVSIEKEPPEPEIQPVSLKDGSERLNMTKQEIELESLLDWQRARQNSKEAKRERKRLQGAKRKSQMSLRDGDDS